MYREHVSSRISAYRAQSTDPNIRDVIVCPYQVQEIDIVVHRTGH